MTKYPEIRNFNRVFIITDSHLVSILLFSRFNIYTFVAGGDDLKSLIVAY